ncbi:hypothetical protein [Fibrobacter sp. UWH1]|uniref:hypothetical protein n=1 Tax=Fibrobacter sp. UWH1 TaxID=1964354 RepID=UPI000B5221E2|nr:hypothetical protein [Fibrobacter sp. UWH1]OWV05257.1 hypothetical protein B7992_15520 [Fibrobacter sp. UWH1]
MDNQFAQFLRQLEMNYEQPKVPGCYYIKAEYNTVHLIWRQIAQKFYQLKPNNTYSVVFFIDKGYAIFEVETLFSQSSKGYIVSETVSKPGEKHFVVMQEGGVQGNGAIPTIFNKNHIDNNTIRYGSSHSVTENDWQTTAFNIPSNPNNGFMCDAMSKFIAERGRFECLDEITYISDSTIIEIPSCPEEKIITAKSLWKNFNNICECKESNEYLIPITNKDVAKAIEKGKFDFD